MGFETQHELRPKLHIRRSGIGQVTNGVDTASEQIATKVTDLYGEFRFKVDAKGRVAVPAEFRKVLSDDLVVSREIEDKCLYVFEPESFNDWIEGLFNDRFGGYSSSDRRQVRMRSLLKSRARGTEVDSSGRIMLNPQAREAVGINKDVVLVGNTGYFEIWDADAFDKEFGDIDLGFFYDEPTQG